MTFHENGGNLAGKIKKIKMFTKERMVWLSAFFFFFKPTEGQRNERHTYELN